MAYQQQEAGDRPGRDTFNVGAAHAFNINYNKFKKPKKKPKVRLEQSMYEPANVGCGVAFLGLIVVVAFLLGVVVYFVWVRNDPPDFPDKSDHLPVGVEPPRIVDAAASALISCAREVVLRPATCPQRVDHPPDQASEVRWAVHGDPRDGAQWRYVKRQDRFFVIGVAVMSVSYRVGDDHHFLMQNFTFWVELARVDDKFAVRAVRRYEREPKKAIKKRDPNVDITSSRALVREAFRKCVSGTRSAMAPNCPTRNRIGRGDKVRWHLNGDPAANARQRFDPDTGLIHVTGSYSLTAKFAERFGSDQRHQNGDYDAAISLDSGRLVVVQVSDV
ncbi:hypothetical protein ACGFIY_04835 [Micromonospora chersina]|uniref:hypothetical protein n=1 Tax=Micromonospora chersina TaxID=47854 RepID=UPI003719E65A